jgi:hypothetical protein
MANNYSRRQNTNGYQTRLQRRINLGEDLLGSLAQPLNGIKDLTERDTNVAQWLTENREAVHLIYENRSIARSLPAATNLDLDELSHQDIIDQLREIIPRQIVVLRELVEETRAWDGMARVPA